MAIYNKPKFGLKSKTVLQWEYDYNFFEILDLLLNEELAQA